MGGRTTPKNKRVNSAKNTVLTRKDKLELQQACLQNTLSDPAELTNSDLTSTDAQSVTAEVIMSTDSTQSDTTPLESSVASVQTERPMPVLGAEAQVARAHVSPFGSMSNGGFWESIPKFSGKDGESVKQFLDTLHMVADHAMWSSKDTMVCLKLKLVGEAGQFVTQNPLLNKESDLVKLEKALKERFASRECLSSNTRRLLQQYQRPDESVKQFAARVQALFYKCIPEEEHELPLRQQSIEMLLQVFVWGLLPTLRSAVLNRSHKDFEAARKHAIIEEELFQKMGNPDRGVPQVQVAQPASDLTDRLARQEQQISQLTASVIQLTSNFEKLMERSIAQPAAPVVTCFRCQGTGHKSPQCPQPPRNQQRHRYRPPPVQPQYVFVPQQPMYPQGMPFQGQQQYHGAQPNVNNRNNSQGLN